MLPMAHLTSRSRMSGSRWVTTPSWLSGSLKPFLYSSSYSCDLFCLMVECKWDSSVVAHGPQHASPSLWKLMISLHLITRSFSWQDTPGLERSAPGWFSSLACHSFVLPVPPPNSHLGLFHGARAPQHSRPFPSRCQHLKHALCMSSPVDLTPPSTDEVLSPFPSPTSALFPRPL